MDRKYLPSKQFVSRLIILAGMIVVAFGIYTLAKKFRNSGPSELNPTKLSVRDVVQKDTNKNGIPDWEEVIWGLDPNTDGQTNKEYILAKRAILARENTENGITTPTGPLSENENMAREFFAVIMSLQQTGNLNEASLQSVSDAIGQKIVAEPIPDIYTKNQIIIIEDGSLEKIEYYTAFLNLHTEYKNRNIGNELTFVAAALKTSDPGALKIVSDIAESYRSFGKDLLKIPVPRSLVPIVLSLVNNYYKTGQSIQGLIKVFDDPFTSMKAIINYNKYSDLILTDMDRLSDNFK